MTKLSVRALPSVGAVALGLWFAGAIGASAADDVKIAMSWLPDPQHGGYYQAAATGIYAKHGLNKRRRTLSRTPS